MLTGFPERDYNSPDPGTNHGFKVTFEQCPTTGRPHIHVFMYSQRKRSWTAAKEWLHDKFACQGEVRQLKTLIHAQRAFAYVGKEYTRLEEPILIGKTIPQIISQLGCEDDDDSVDPDWKREVHIYYGPPFTGKTTKAIEYCKLKGFTKPFIMPGKAKQSNGRWIGKGFTGQEAVIIEEWNINNFETDQLKLMLDRVPQQLPTTMGGVSTFWAPQLIIMTTNHTLPELKKYFEDPKMPDLWTGRITSFHAFTVVYPTLGRKPTWVEHIPFVQQPSAGPPAAQAASAASGILTTPTTPSRNEIDFLPCFSDFHF